MTYRTRQGLRRALIAAPMDVATIREVSIGVATGATGEGHIMISEVQLVPRGW